MKMKTEHVLGYLMIFNVFQDWGTGLWGLRGILFFRPTHFPKIGSFFPFHGFSMVFHGFPVAVTAATSRSSMKNITATKWKATQTSRSAYGSCDFYGATYCATYCHMPGIILCRERSRHQQDMSDFFRHHWRSWHCKHWINCLLSLLDIWGWLPVTQKLNKSAHGKMGNWWFDDSQFPLSLDGSSQQNTAHPTWLLRWSLSQKASHWPGIAKANHLQTLKCQQHVLNHLGWVPRFHVFDKVQVIQWGNPPVFFIFLSAGPW